MSWLSYAFRLMYLPVGLFGVSVATAAIPRSRVTRPRDRRRTSGGRCRGVFADAVLNVPATVGLMVLAPPIVALIYERGNSRRPIRRHRGAPVLLRARHVGYSVVKIASPTFYALGEQPDAGHRLCGHGARQRRVNLALVRRSAIAAWRSGRRSRPSSTRRLCSVCSGDGLDARRLLSGLGGCSEVLAAAR